MDTTHDLLRYIHILLFVFWLGADVGVYATMIFVKNSKLAMDTRLTLIKLAFYIDLFPRACFALFIPVGFELVNGLGLMALSLPLRLLALAIGLAWAGLHVLVVAQKGSTLAQLLRRINAAFEAIAGLAFVTLGVSYLTRHPDSAWLGLKLLLFGLIFWVVLGIDLKFQPFTMIMRMAATGSTHTQEAQITRATNQTLAWALLLYVLILIIAFLGTVKPL